MFVLKSPNLTPKTVCLLASTLDNPAIAFAQTDYKFKLTLVND
jgi:hypothetical protein